MSAPARERQQALERAVATMSELQRRAEPTSAEEKREEPPDDGGGSGGSSDGEATTPSSAATKKERTSEPRVSSTDAEARVMKMADGGFRPAYNLQFAVDVATGLIVGVELLNAGSDSHQMVPMHEQLLRRYGRRADTYLVDGGFANLAAIQRLAEDGVRVLASRPKPRKQGIDVAVHGVNTGAQRPAAVS